MGPTPSIPKNPSFSANAASEANPMSTTMATPLFKVLLPGAFLLVSSSLRGQTIIDDDFDDGTVTGWIGQGNTRTFSAHNITEAGTILTSEVVPTQPDTNRGIVSTTSFSPASVPGGFSMTFTVTSEGPPAPAANGFFIGIVSDNQDFFRNLPNFGLVFFGTDTRTGSGNGFSIVYGDKNGTSPADFILGNSDAQGDVELASFQDGFTANLTADANGWSYLIEGLKSADGSETTFAGSGLWADAGTNFAALFGGDDSWFVMASNQGPGAAAGLPTHIATYDRISLVGGEPAAFEILTIETDLESADPTVVIRWSSSPGQTYSVDYSEDLSVWIEIVDSLPTAGGVTAFTHHFLPNYPSLVGKGQIYYRVRR